MIILYPGSHDYVLRLFVCGFQPSWIRQRPGIRQAAITVLPFVVMLVPSPHLLHLFPLGIG